MGSPDLVVLGNLLIDDVVFDDGRTRMRQPGGAALYCALGARLWEIGVGIVSRIGDDYPPAVLERLSRLGVDLAGITSIGRPSLRTWLLYEGELRRVVHRLEGPTHADVSPGLTDLPSSWRQADWFHLAPMPLTIQRELAEALQRLPGARLSLDPYELLTDEALDDWRRMLAHVDLFLFSEDEMEVAGGRDDPVPVLRRISGRGRLAHILFKQGGRGGLRYDTRSRKATPWLPRAEAVVDATGAGDAFAGGLLAGLVSGEPLSRALAMGGVSASLAVGAEGASGLLVADPAYARRQLDSWCDTFS